MNLENLERLAVHLENLPAPDVRPKRTGWINIYDAGDLPPYCGRDIFDTEEEARENAAGHVLATVQIPEWESGS